VTKVFAGWVLYLVAPLVLTGWDALYGMLSHRPPRALVCMETPTIVVYLAMCVLWTSGTREMRGGWGALLRIILILGQLWMAAVVQFFVIDPLRAETGVYSGTVCGDL
jgi:hypothetical protein